MLLHVKLSLIISQYKAVKIVKDVWYLKMYQEVFVPSYISDIVHNHPTIVNDDLNDYNQAGKISQMV